MKFYEEAFEGAVEIVAAAMEENEVELSAAGGDKVAEFFKAVYLGLAGIEGGDEDQPAKPGCFELYRDAKGEYRFRLKAANGQIIAVSEGYSSKGACIKGIESVQRSAAGAELEEV